jgi:hypothetical protein
MVLPGCPEVYKKRINTPTKSNIKKRRRRLKE